MSPLKSQRGSIRRSFTRTYNELKEEMDKDDGNAGNILMFRKRLEDRFHQLVKIDEQILQELREQDVAQNEMDEEFDAIQEYRDKWNDVNSSDLCVSTQEDNRSVALSTTSHYVNLGTNCRN